MYFLYIVFIYSFVHEKINNAQGASKKYIVYAISNIYIRLALSVDIEACGYKAVDHYNLPVASGVIQRNPFVCVAAKLLIYIDCIISRNNAR